MSREHFMIDHRDAGYVLVDRASTCGTIVEGETVGGERKGGTSRSPYVFKFRVG